MFEKIFYDFFLINLNEYPNINIDLEINVLLFFISLAICASAFAITIYRATLQRAIKQLTRLGATDEDSARTIKDLGLEKSFILKMALSRRGRLTRIIGRAGEKTYTYEEYVELSRTKGGIKEEKIDFETAEFYIRPESNDDAKNIIENYGTSMLRTSLYCVLVIAVYICVALVMPEVLTLINNLLA